MMDYCVVFFELHWLVKYLFAIMMITGIQCGVSKVKYKLLKRGERPE
jgi:hypothetical protein